MHADGSATQITQVDHGLGGGQVGATEEEWPATPGREISRSAITGSWSTRRPHCQRTAALSTETAQAGLGSHQIESNLLAEPEWEK